MNSTSFSVVPLILVMAAGNAIAQETKLPAKLVAARAAFQKSLDSAEVAKDDAISKAIDLHQSVLSDLLVEETKAGNLDNAILIREEIRGLKLDGSGSNKIKTRQDLAKVLSGTRWDWGDSPVTFQANGFVLQANWEKAKQVTKWKAIDRRTVVLTIVQSDRKTDLVSVITFSESIDEFDGQEFFGSQLIARKKLPPEKK